MYLIVCLLKYYNIYHKLILDRTFCFFQLHCTIHWPVNIKTVLPSRVEFRYNAVSLPRCHMQRCDDYDNLNRLYTHKTPHTSPSRASYGVPIVRIFEKIDLVIMTLWCIRIPTIQTLVWEVKAAFILELLLSIMYFMTSINIYSYQKSFTDIKNYLQISEIKLTSTFELVMPFHHLQISSIHFYASLIQINYL